MNVNMNRYGFHKSNQWKIFAIGGMQNFKKGRLPSMTLRHLITALWKFFRPFQWYRFIQCISYFQVKYEIIQLIALYNAVKTKVKVPFL